MTCAASHGGGIIRSPRPEKAFEIVPHARIRDKNLTYRARGVLERLLSNSDGFAMSAEELAMESSREKRTAILTSLRELREAGYLVTRRSQNKRGQWITENLIFDTPQMLTIKAVEPVRKTKSSSTRARREHACRRTPAVLLLRIRSDRNKKHGGSGQVGWSPGTPATRRSANALNGRPPRRSWRPRWRPRAPQAETPCLAESRRRCCNGARQRRAPPPPSRSTCARRGSRLNLGGGASKSWPS